MHDDDGTAIYLMKNTAPITITKELAQREIERLSKLYNETPIVQWLPREAPTAVIASWGKVELRKLSQSDIELIANGKSPRRGLLIDFLGNFLNSAKAGVPIFRITGGGGYLYAASFDPRGQGHQQHVAADMSPQTISKWESELHEVLKKDQQRAADDYGLWSSVAEIARNIALEMSPTIANDILDRVFSNYSSRKLHSHVWSILPLGTRGVLAAGIYYTDIIYRSNTKHTDILFQIQRSLMEKPNEPFSEFLYLTIGEFDKALAHNPQSIIAPIANYAAGYAVIDSIMREIRKTVSVRPSSRTPVNDTLMALNQNAAIYGIDLYGALVPDFATKANAAKPYLESVLSNQLSPLRDDAAYMLGWLALHQGKFKEAVQYSAEALRYAAEASLAQKDRRRQDDREPTKKVDDPVGDEPDDQMDFGDRTDYAEAATRQLARALVRLPVSEQLDLIRSTPILSLNAALWWQVTVRGAYRNLDHKLAVEIGETALRALGVPIDRLPVTTNPELIADRLKTLKINDEDAPNVAELVYLIEASREILAYGEFLQSARSNKLDSVTKRTKEIVFKFSLLIDDAEKAAEHKDLRQAVYLIDITLENTPKTQDYAALREWLQYRRIRALAEFRPKDVSKAVAEMEREFPKSKYLDDALAEEVYVEGVRLDNISASEHAFNKLLRAFPKGNAVDNAYSWMAIAYQCAGQMEAARKLNREILKKFATTRHAEYARIRLSNPEAVSCKLSVYDARDVYHPPRRLRP